MLPIFFSGLGNGQDKGKIEEIWNNYRGLMLKVAVNFVGKDLADDVVSETFIKLIQNIDKINDISSYKTKGYIVSIVRSVSIDFLRRAKRSTEGYQEIPETVSDEAEDLLDGLVAKEGVTAINRAIQGLPDHLKDVLYLSMLYGHNHAEIAKLLNITEAASRMRLYRARNEIKKKLVGENDK